MWWCRRQDQTQRLRRFERAGASSGQSVEVSAIQIGVLLDGGLSAMADFEASCRKGHFGPEATGQ